MRKLKLDELGRVDIPTFKNIPKVPVIVVLDNIRSAMNVGSFLRTADAFKIRQVILSGITAKPPHKEILKTAIGASKSVNWTYVDSATSELAALKKKGFKIIGVEQTDQSIPLQDYRPISSEQYVLIFGNEVNGLDEAILPLLDTALEIPQFGTKHSLNVAVCGGIIIWHFARVYLI